MKAPERIETARLVLRRPQRSDADAMFARYASDPDVTKFLGWPTHGSVEDTIAFVQFSDSEWQRSAAGPYLITSRGDERVLGSTGLGIETPHRAMTGYVLARDSWGHGFATEALRAMVDLAERLGIVRLYALCHLDHAPSWRILERSGFVREGTLRRYAGFPNLAPSEPCDVLCYARILGGRPATADDAG